MFTSFYTFINIHIIYTKFQYYLLLFTILSLASHKPHVNFIYYLPNNQTINSHLYPITSLVCTSSRLDSYLFGSREHSLKLFSLPASHLLLLSLLYSLRLSCDLPLVTHTITLCSFICTQIFTFNFIIALHSRSASPLHLSISYVPNVSYF